ncbi:MAG TPA: hypothetical protein VE957_03575 [Terriglobales bacterium]|nr:hypothetical protein [Terriglobales bacterium]
MRSHKLNAPKPRMGDRYTAGSVFRVDERVTISHGSDANRTAPAGSAIGANGRSVEAMYDVGKDLDFAIEADLIRQRLREFIAKRDIIGRVPRP